MRNQWWPWRLVTAMLVVLAACGSPAAQPSGGGQTTPYRMDSLDHMLAPIALYPDSLLAQILMSAGDPASVTKLDNWLKGTAGKLKGSALQDAAVKAGFEASFVALTIFPQVVATMAQQIAWTTTLGEAFTANRMAVFDTIQKLRAQAKNVGTLKSTPQQDVETRKTESGQEVIVIEPTNPQIVYVPQYNTEVVYTQPPSTTTVIVQEDDDDGAEAAAAGMIGFTAGIVIGASMNNSYYYGPYGYHGGGYMYADAWDDYYDHREDAREDYMDHREDVMEERSDRLEDRSETRSDRVENTQGQRTERQQNRQENPQAAQQRAQSASAASANRSGSTTARGYGDGSRATTRSSGSSDAFSGYSSGASQRSASSRGQRSRSSSGGGGRSGGGRRR